MQEEKPGNARIEQRIGTPDMDIHLDIAEEFARQLASDAKGVARVALEASRSRVYGRES